MPLSFKKKTSVLNSTSSIICPSIRFLVWLDELSVDVANRKASFQGPNLIAYVDKMEWQDFKVCFTLVEKPLFYGILLLI